MRSAFRENSRGEFRGTLGEPIGPRNLCSWAARGYGGRGECVVNSRGHWASQLALGNRVPGLPGNMGAAGTIENSVSGLQGAEHGEHSEFRACNLQKLVPTRRRDRGRRIPSVFPL